MRSIEIYQQSEQGWVFATRLFGSDSMVGDAFGNAIDLDGDTLIVGAPDAANNQGRAYVFRRVGGEWLEESMLSPAPVENARFGKAVAVEDNVAVVLGRSPNTIPFAEGAEIGGYVFERDNNGWGPGEVLVSNIGGDDQNATQVSISNGRVLVDRAYVGHLLIFTDTMEGWKVTATPRSNLLNFYAGGQQARTIASDGDYIFFSPSRFIPVYPADLQPETSTSNLIQTYGVIEIFDSRQSYRSVAELSPHVGVGQRTRIGDEMAASGGLLVNYTVAGTALPVTMHSIYMIDLELIDDGDGVDFDHDVCPLQSPVLISDCNGRPLYDTNEDCRVNGIDLVAIVSELLDS